MSGPYDKQTLIRYAATQPYDRAGRSVRELALIRWFVRKSYLDLCDAAINEHADTIFMRMTERR